MWSSASALPLCLNCQIYEVMLSHFRSALTGKDMKFRFPHLFCQDFQRCEVPLPHLISAWTSKDLQFRFCTFAQSLMPKIWRSAYPLILCLHCQIWEVPPPHFPSALTAEDLQFHISDLPSFPKMWMHFCSALTAKILPPQFRRRFILCISTQFRAVLHEGLALQRDEASLFASKNLNHLIHT